MADAQILVGDVGGTHARFALARPDGSLADVATFEVRDFATAEDAVDQYLGSLSQHPKTFCIASAGKRTGDEIALTNAHWVLGEEALRDRFGFEKGILINDFHALAQGAAGASLGQMIEVQAGEAGMEAPRLCLGPGTGFGQALILPGLPPRVVPTEGGFRLLPVRTKRDRDLFARLERELGAPPIVEEGLSGRGFVHLLSALRGQAQTLEAPAITAAALAGLGDEREAVMWFLELLATAAADACLMTGAWGGVIIGGGVVPRIVSLLDREAFSATFARSSPMQEQLERVPVHLMTDGLAALRGAAALAFQTA